MRTLSRAQWDLLPDSLKAGDPDRHDTTVWGLRLSTGEPIWVAVDVTGPALFALGQLVATPAALDAAGRAGIDLIELVWRHQAGDWGEVCPDDADANNAALATGGRVLSAYPLEPGTRVWVLTEADRFATTVLLPSDY